MRFARSPADVGDAGHDDRRNSESDLAARRQPGEGVLFLSPAARAGGYRGRRNDAWFLNLMEELGIECRVGNPVQMRAAEPRKQKHDRRDAELILKLLAENRFPAIWLPSKELLDLRALLPHRHQWGRACAHAYRMRYRRLPWPMVYGAVTVCGASRGRRKSRFCHYSWFCHYEPCGHSAIGR